MKILIKSIRFSLAAAVLSVAVLAFFSLSNVEPSKASPSTPVPVNVFEGEWFVTPTPSSASGDHFIMFNVTNVSAILPHEFVVIRLKHGQTYDNLPISTNPASEFFGRVDEDALGPQIKGAIEEDALPPGSTAVLNVGLPPGEYALICNLPGHYFLGMRSLLTNNGPHDKDKGKHHGKDNK